MKKHLQLGMNAGTASHRLVKDILFSFVKKAEHKCYRCGGDLARENFSIEHKEAWLDSTDPVKLFFDLDNIAFSHIKCNVSAKRTVNKLCYTEEEKKDNKNFQERERWRNLSVEEQRKIRRDKYLRNGK